MSTTTGTVDVGPVGTPLPPTDSRFFGAQGLLDDASSELGYLSEDGVTVRHVPARWRFLARTPAHTEASFTLLGQVDLAPLTPRISLMRRALMAVGWAKATPASWVFRVLDGGGRVGITVPRGEVAWPRRSVRTALDDLQYGDGDVAATRLTIKAWPDEKGNNVYVMTEER